MSPVSSYRMVVILYAALGVVLACVCARVSPTAEASPPGKKAADRATGLADLPGVKGSRDVVFLAQRSA